MPARRAVGGHTANGDNPLLRAATPLLNTVVQLRMAATHDDPAGLRLQLIDEVRLFETRCKQAGLPFDMLIGCRYCLCSVLDEAASRTPWGSRGVWSGSGLLVTFHTESGGGEKFFQLLSRLSEQPQPNLWLLEVMHYCLLLGYEGRYRGLENGRAEREATVQRLGALLAATHRPLAAAPLANLVVPPAHTALWRPPVPLWAALMLTALLAGLVYTALNWRLGNAAEPVLREIYQSARPIADRRSGTPLLALRDALAPEVHRQALQVNDGPVSSNVIVPSDTLFGRDASVLTAEGRALLLRVARVMGPIDGTLTISAYTDDGAHADGRFASSYEYTLAQARAVATLLSQHGQGARRALKTEGRGDSGALLPNDTAENRQRNRRVELVLSAAPPADAERAHEVPNAD
ncbi:type IVB secretion system protein IcmH/DotU [Pantoea sp. 1.19]|uniref:type IVB secretion system protein IcmH/DotU n=1 Tax=Pantoea sp. 1.19 TaxID=1925589 RepID=UPI0009490287|nr:type IVB secretion system protein IcmH/DotU [Pantoea sp. 1.19]